MRSAYVTKQPTERVRVWSSHSAYTAGTYDLVSNVPAPVFADAEFSATKLSKMVRFTEQEE